MLTRINFEQLILNAESLCFKEALASESPELLIQTTMRDELVDILQSDETFGIDLLGTFRSIDNHAVAEIPEGTPIRISIYDPEDSGPLRVFQSTSTMVQRKLSDLHNGLTAEYEFYCIDTGFFSDSPEAVRVLQVIKRYQSIRTILDSIGYRSSQEWLFFYRVVVPIPDVVTSEIEELVLHGFNLDATDELIDFVNREDHQSHRRSIFASALVHFLQHEPKETRLYFLLNRIEAIKDSCLSSFQLYLEKFSYEQLRNDLHSETTAFLRELGDTLENVRNQVIIISTSAIALSQFQTGEYLRNFAILLAIFIATLLYNAVITNQAETLADIVKRIRDTENQIINRQQDLYEREFKGWFKDLYIKGKRQGRRVLLFRLGLWISFVVAVALCSIVSIQ